MGIEGLKNDLPRRIPGNHLVYHGRKLVLVSKSKGKVLEINVLPDDPNLKDYFRFFKIRLSREFMPPRLIRIEIINNQPATKSPYMQALVDFGFMKDFNSLVLRRSL
jgi:ATP-dependent Lhr-like helicase